MGSVRMRGVRGVLRLLLILTMSWGIPAVHANARTGPGRIAVAGAYPTGYIGLLARYGLPRDILLDYQLSDPAVVSRYNVLIIAGPVSVAPEALAASLQRFFANGGNLLLDYSALMNQAAAPITLREWLAGGRRGTSTLLGFPAPAGRSVAPFALTAGQDNPLRAALGDAPPFPNGGRLGLVVDTSTLKNYKVLAEYVSNGLFPGGLNRRQMRRLGFPAAGAAVLPGAAPTAVPAVFPAVPAAAPASPMTAAIVLEQRDKGRVLHCGPAVAFGTSLGGMDFDRLMLGMIRVLTDGRAVPQLEPEGPHLARKQSPRSLTRGGSPTAASQAEDATQEPEATPMPVAVAEAPARPKGPGSRGALPAGYTPVEPDPAVEYNLAGKMPAAGGTVLLNYWNSANCLRVTLSPSGLRIARVAGGKTTSLAYDSKDVAPGTPFIIRERSPRLSVIAGLSVATAPLAGVPQGQIAAQGALGDLHYQPVEPPCFGDDFMRTSDQDGGWETAGGTWKTAATQNPDMGANPFSYKVEAKGVATSMAGYPFWDEYHFAASARMDATQGAMALGFYARDPNNMLLFQARAREASPRANDGFALVRLQDGKPEVLAQCSGGMAPGQWYRLEVRVQGPWIAAWVDGVKLLTAKDTTFSGGKIALRAEDTLGRFDDVVVEPATTPSASGQRIVAHVPPYAGVIDVDSWAGPATPWEPDPETAGLLWRRGLFCGDVGLRFDLPALPSGARAMLLLDGDGVSGDSGYSVTLSRSAGGGRLELRRAGSVVAQSSVPADKPLTLSLRRERDRIIALVDSRAVAETKVSGEPGGSRIAFQALGFRPKISSVAVWSANIRDYTFDAAPVDWWVGSGDWDVTNRWSCTPDWSWFGGYSKDVAAIWNKEPFEGDTVLDFYVGPKMVPVDATGLEQVQVADRGAGARQRMERFANLNAVLCGDGRSVDSGYAFIVAEAPATPGYRGQIGQGAKILRRGQVVAQRTDFQMFTRGHNRWANIRCEKHGNRISLFVEGQLVLQYDDPDPLPGGYAGIWTRANGIMVPRITLFFEGIRDDRLSLN